MTDPTPHTHVGSVDCGECPLISTGCRAGQCMKASPPTPQQKSFAALYERVESTPLYQATKSEVAAELRRENAVLTINSKDIDKIKSILLAPEVKS